MALSIDVRTRALAFYDAGLSTKQVAERLAVSPAWARRMKQRRREGKPLAPGTTTGRRPRLDADARATLSAWVDERPDATLEELRVRCRGELGLAVSSGTIWNALRAGRLTYKKSRSSPPSSAGPTSRPRATRS